MPSEIRKRIFVGCEGKGERALTVVLQKFADESGVPVFLDAFDSHGGGSLSIVRKSIREMGVRSQRRGRYDGGAFILLDDDRFVSDGDSAKIIDIVNRNSIVLVRQIPNLECFIGRLLSGQFDLGDIRSRAALRAQWHDYEKDFDAMSLKVRITADRLRQSQLIGAEWRAFITAVGII